MPADRVALSVSLLGLSALPSSSCATFSRLSARPPSHLVSCSAHKYKSYIIDSKTDVGESSPEPLFIGQCFADRVSDARWLVATGNESINAELFVEWYVDTRSGKWVMNVSLIRFRKLWNVCRHCNLHELHIMSHCTSSRSINAEERRSSIKSIISRSD